MGIYTGDDRWRTDDYSIVPGRKYEKLARALGSSREVVAFRDASTGQWFEAQSWKQRGRMADVESSAIYEEMAAGAQR